MSPIDETVPKHLGIKVIKTKIDHTIALALHTLGQTLVYYNTPRNTRIPGPSNKNETLAYKTYAICSLH